MKSFDLIETVRPSPRKLLDEAVCATEPARANAYSMASTLQQPANSSCNPLLAEKNHDLL